MKLCINFAEPAISCRSDYIGGYVSTAMGQSKLFTWLMGKLNLKPMIPVEAGYLMVFGPLSRDKSNTHILLKPIVVMNNPLMASPVQQI